MYVHSPNSKGNRNINIPYNYGGNTFSREGTPDTKIHRPTPSPIPIQRHEQESAVFEERDTATEDMSLDEPYSDTDDKNEHLSVQSCREVAKKDDIGALGRLLGGIGSEELLLIALLLLISQGEKNDDLSLILLLLLFIK